SICQRSIAMIKPEKPVSSEESRSDLTPSERSAQAIRVAIIEGYQDAIAGRTVAFEGNLRSLLSMVNQSR
ncbi:MAG TPA: hypothetical protein VL096_07930, partial [Pirellulaceae bacterium]|nr:hypothetical protein [Pirellulaceae bacterium]